MRFLTLIDNTSHDVMFLLCSVFQPSPSSPVVLSFNLHLFESPPFGGGGVGLLQVSHNRVPLLTARKKGLVFLIDFWIANKNSVEPVNPFSLQIITAARDLKKN